ncbi:MAG: hypothetical protein K2W95_28935 [Candidatus Obscuribacterales bacterium]|nr:hypothetical protein [Candidatus Obscuribacterales bacterium]
MSRIETSSHTGQNAPPPEQDERDEASSMGGGRKAEARFGDHHSKTGQSSMRKREHIEPPVGLDLETRGDIEITKSSRKSKDDAEDSNSNAKGNGGKEQPSLRDEATRQQIHRSAPAESAEQLRQVAEQLESENKPATAQKVRAAAAKITLQQQNELDGFPLPNESGS